MADQAPAEKKTTRRFRGWRKITAITLVSVLLASWGVSHYATGSIRTVVEERLAKRGLTAKWGRASWGPIRGLVLSRLEIRHIADGGLVVSADNLTVRFPLTQFLHGGERTGYWSTRGSTVVLDDGGGPITLEEVSAKVESHGKKLIVKKASARKDGLAARVRGEIQLGPPPPGPRPPFRLKLRPLRSTLAVLDFGPDGKPFQVEGTFSVDTGKPGIEWSTQLNGSGESVVWKGVPLEHAEAAARVSSSGSEIRAKLATKDGVMQGILTRGGWRTTPLAFEGTLEDKDGRKDGFSGSYEKGTVTVDRLQGPADLLQIARTIPGTVDHLPARVEIRDFPTIDVRGITWNRERDWSVESVRISGEGSAVFELDGDTIPATDLSGLASYKDRTWTVKDARAEIFGGSIGLDGNFKDGQLSGAVVKARGIRLSEIKRLEGVKGEGGPGILALDYRGAIGLNGRNLDGGGSMKLENAPVFDIPLIEEVYDLFSSLIPKIDRGNDGRFEADFTGSGSTVEVTRFEATGGSLTVNAEGSVNLDRQTVSGTARGELKGAIPGLLSRPVGRLLEMEVSGPFGDIRLKPVGPAKLASGVGEALEEPKEFTKDLLDKGVRAPMRFFKGKRSGRD